MLHLLTHLLPDDGTCCDLRLMANDMCSVENAYVLALLFKAVKGLFVILSKMVFYVNLVRKTYLFVMDIFRFTTTVSIPQLSVLSLLHEQTVST